MNPRPLPHHRRRASLAGFTLVELMVAVTGGLFVSIMLFVLARDGARFYQRESRVADATLASMVGFERLHADIARAGFLASPNIQIDPRRCGPLPPAGQAQLRSLAAIRIQPGFTDSESYPALPQVLADNGRTPDTITLAGSYASVEEFPMWGVVDHGGSGYTVYLQRQIGPAARMGLTGTNDAADLALLQPIFQAGRALRIVDQRSMCQYGVINNVAVVAGEPSITLTTGSALQMRLAGSTLCGLTNPGTGSVNVVNFVRYQIASLSGEARYAPVYNDPNPWDATRTELVREELDTTGAPILATRELVAEYAVDLRFGVSFVNFDPDGTPGSLSTLAPGNANIATAMGDVNSGPSTTVYPHRARVIRVRLSVRSREPDRDAQILPGAGVAPGFYRMGLGTGTSGTAAPPFARVRTLQADVTLHNLVGIRWP
jgi:hypothetical protein